MGRSIDERDSNVDERNEFGHWEIDTVIGSKSKSDNVVLTLVERITRKYIALKITSKTSFAVNEGIAYLKLYIDVGKLYNYRSTASRKLYTKACKYVG